MYFYNLGSCFSEISKKTPQNPALRYPERDYTYADLELLTDRLAAFLLNKGCRRGDVIAIAHSKKPLSYALMLAGLKLGVTYVNIDINSPLARNACIIKTGHVRFVFYDDAHNQHYLEELAQSNDSRAVFLCDDILPQMSTEMHARQQQLMMSVDGACIAYIMFTSGSTGDPKGVAVTHQNVLHFIAWGKQRFSADDRHNFANLNPMYFDNSVFDFYVGLFSGACLSPVPRQLMTNPYELVKYVSERQCTIWFSVPSLIMFLMTMKAMTAKALPSLRYIVFGGEGYPKTELKKLFDEFTGQATLVNVYGPTECTCICSAHDIVDNDFEDMEGLPTLGHLNPNFDYQILDEQGMSSDFGELCLIGPNVASGYFNDLDRTASAFVTLTDSNRFMKRMYRTGDLVQEVQGRLYFKGRKDNQIKHMGYRIELEEIEQAMIRLPQVDQAAAVYRRVNPSYGKIIGFVASRTDLEEQSLLSELSELLPDYMLPSKIILHRELPKNSNGKIDRNQLATSLK